MYMALVQCWSFIMVTLQTTIYDVHIHCSNTTKAHTCITHRCPASWSLYMYKSWRYKQKAYSFIKSHSFILLFSYSVYQLILKYIARRQRTGGICLHLRSVITLWKQELCILLSIYSKQFSTYIHFCTVSLLWARTKDVKKNKTFVFIL